MALAKICDIIIDMKPTFGHCAIVTGYSLPRTSGPPYGSRVTHATTRGVRSESWEYGEAYCFRSKNLTKAEAEKISNVAQEIFAHSNYGTARAVFKSWAGSSTFGSSAMKRLEKYRSRMTTDQTEATIKNVYCSELVVVAYQIGLDLDTSNQSWIDLDGKHTLPSTLKTWLERSPTRWECVGKITGISLNVASL
jgi:hypothetical protein